MLPFVLKRLLAAIPVVCVVGLFVFSLLYIAPGDPAAIIAGDQATAADIAQIRESLGLDRPFFLRFAEWMWGVMRGDLGQSIFTKLPVTTLILQRLEPTLSLLALSFLTAILIAIPSGVLAAAKRDTAADRIVMVMAGLGFSVPSFVVAYLLVYFFSIELKWFPVQSYTPLSFGFLPWLRSITLPSLALGFSFAALITCMTRASMLEVLLQDYVRAATAKGAARPAILFIHAFKNAAIPVVTVVGIGVAGLIGGAVVAETVFSIPGVGRLMIDAILRRDYPVVQGVVLYSSLAYVTINVLVDIIYVLIDPRIRY